MYIDEESAVALIEIVEKIEAAAVDQALSAEDREFWQRVLAEPFEPKRVQLKIV